MKPQDLDALIVKLQGLKTAEGKAVEDVAERDIASMIQGSAQPVYQIAFDAGHRSATGTLTPQIEQATAKVTAAEAKLTGLQAKITELEGKQPELAQVRQQHEQQLAQLRTEHETATKQLKDTISDRDRKRATLDLQLLLSGDDHNVEGLIARSLATGEDVQKRLKLNADGTLEVFQKDAAIPFAPDTTKGQTALGLLAAELAKTVGPQYKRSKGDRGAGAGAGGSGGSGAGSLSAMKERLKEERKAEAPAGDGGKTIGERFRSRG